VHTGAGVGNAEQFQRSLNRAVFAIAAVQRDEDAVEFLRDQGREVALPWIEGMGVNALAAQCLDTPAFLAI